MMNAGAGKRWIAIILIFSIGITGVRLIWLEVLKAFEYPAKAAAVRGIVDLRGWTFTDHQTLKLDGEWEFYPAALIAPGESTGRDPFAGAKKTYAPVPGSWNPLFDEDEAYRYGTYRLRILTEPGIGKTFGLRFREAGNASAVYVNGKLLHEAGRPSADREQYAARRYAFTVTVPPERDELEVVVLVSSHTREGGITLPVRRNALFHRIEQPKLALLLAADRLCRIQCARRGRQAAVCLAPVGLRMGGEDGLPVLCRRFDFFCCCSSTVCFLPSYTEAPYADFHGCAGCMRCSSWRCLPRTSCLRRSCSLYWAWRPCPSAS